MESLKQQIVWGALYTALSRYSNILMTLAVTAVLSRLLTPQDFGMAAIAMIAMGLFQIVADLGISPAIVQNKGLCQEDLHAIYSFTLWAGLALSTVFFFLAWPLERYYGSENLRPLCHLLCLGVFFLSAATVPTALLLKNKEFKFIAMRNLFLSLSGGLITIVSAVAGAGVYSIVINPILVSVFTFFISIKKYPQTFRVLPNVVSLRKILAYSSYQMLFNSINYCFRNIDKVMIGKFMTMDLLGLYTRSYSLMMIPVLNITHVITPAVHPVFSEHQKNLSQVIAAYEQLVRFLAFAGFALSGFFFFTASEIVLIVLGEQWIQAIPVFQVLCISIGIQTALASSGSVFQAFGDTKTMFVCALFSLIVNAIGITAGIFLFKTLIAVACAVGITFLLNFILCYVLMYKKIFKRNIKYLLFQFVSPSMLGIAVSVALLCISPALDGINVFISLCIKGFVFLFVSLLYIHFTKEYDVLGSIGKLVHRRQS